MDRELRLSRLVAIFACLVTIAAGCRGRALPPARPPLAVQKCGAPPDAVARLDSYLNVQVPGRYWVDMMWESGEWTPVAPIPMPHHHATRLEMTNLSSFPALAAHQGHRLRFTVEITARDIRQIAGRNEWRATYEARVIDVCLSA